MITDYLYLWLKEKLKTIDEIKTIEPDWNQDESEGSSKENQLISTPTILINLTGDVATADLADHAQECEMDVEIRLITKNVREKDNRIRQVDKENHLDIARLVFKKLQRIHSGKISEVPEFAALAETENDFILVDSISRIGTGFSNDFDKYVRSSQTFRIAFRDLSANETWEKTVATLEITNLEILPE